MMSVDGRMTGDDQTEELSRPSSPQVSTLFSNKLIDLAISVDTEESTRRRLEFRNKNINAEREARELKTALNVLETITSGPVFGPKDIRREIEKETRRTLLSQVNSNSPTFKNKLIPSGVTISACNPMDMDDGSSDSEEINGLSATSSSSSRLSRGATGQIQSRDMDSPNLLTVFSSPCRNYYQNRKNNMGPDGTELPEYVKMMMEKDPSLRRLVKTGCVTISRINPDLESGSENQDSKLDENDEYWDSECNNGNALDVPEDNRKNGYSRPYDPPGNIEDWTDFPFARKLLEFTYQSTTSVDFKTGNSLAAKYIAKPGSNLHPTSMRAMKKSESHKLLPSIPLPSSQFKSVLKPAGPGLVHTAPRTRTYPNEKLKITKLKPVPVNGARKRSRSRRTHTVGVNVPSVVSNVLLDSSLDDSIDQIDITSFLEVSLQETAIVPDDSHRRKYKCTHCSKAFCWSTDLKRHLLIHTGERPFSCTVCPANFTRKFLMQKHVKKVHGQALTAPIGEADFYIKYQDQDEYEEVPENGVDVDSGIQYLITDNSEDGSKGADSEDPQASCYNDSEDLQPSYYNDGEYLQMENDDDYSPYNSGENSEAIY